MAVETFFFCVALCALVLWYIPLCKSSTLEHIHTIADRVIVELLAWIYISLCSGYILYFCAENKDTMLKTLSKISDIVRGKESQQKQ